VDGEGNFFVGSLTHGTIHRVSLSENTLTTPFETDDLVGVVGMVVEGDALWVCHSSPVVQNVAQIVGFDLESGAELVRHSFPSEDATLTRGSGICNDLAFDGNGNLYATDSFGDAATNPAGMHASRILRVSAADLMTANSAEVWLEDPAFVVTDAQFGVNGIDFDGNDRLFVTVNPRANTLYEIAVSAAGEAGNPAPVTTSEPLTGGDGLKLIDENTLMLVQQSTLTRVDLETGTVTHLTSPEFATEFLTTFAVFGSAAWVVEGQLDHLLGFDPTPPMLPFRVLRVPLPGNSP
jgi:sugar lactone lactonase YvrE